MENGKLTIEKETAAHLPFNILHGGCQKVNRERIEKQFHKDNLRHLSRFPDFFLTFRILSANRKIICSGEKTFPMKITSFSLVSLVSLCSIFIGIPWLAVFLGFVFFILGQPRYNLYFYYKRETAAHLPFNIFSSLKRRLSEGFSKKES